jgi:hypothetical protein
MNIGRVLEEEYTDKEGKKQRGKVLDLRTLTLRKRFNVSLNKNKYPDGKTVAAGQEEKADFHIWYNFANKGESGMSEIVGGFKKAVSEKGLNYLRGFIYDPSFAGGILWISAFTVDKEKPHADGHTHNIVWSPLKKKEFVPNGEYQEQRAEPAYYHDGIPTYVENIPAVYEVEDEEIPF